MHYPVYRSPVLLVGDFNFRDINWKNRHGISAPSKNFLNVCDDFFLNQYVEDCTRCENILDLVLSNANIIYNVEVGENFAESDHQIIRFDIVLTKQNTENNTSVYDFKNADWDNFTNVLNKIKWEDKFRDLSCEDMWDIFKSILFDLQDKYIPLKMLRKNINKSPIWMNKEIRLLSQETYKKYKIMKTQQTEESIDSYKNTLKEKKSLIQKTKSLSQLELANKSKDFKEFFKYFSNINKTPKVMGHLIKDNIVAESDIEMAELLNNHFSSVYLLQKT